MSTFIVLLLTGLGLAGLYFLVASGLSLVFGLADVLNFAHGVFISIGSFVAWSAMTSLPGAGSEGFGFVYAALVGVLAGAVIAAVVELVLIRPLYRRPIAQVLVTVGLSLAGVALLQVIWGPDAVVFPRPAWTTQVTVIAGASVPNSVLLLIAGSGLVLVALLAFLRFTKVGLVIRAGVEDRAMVTALGIDVRKAFTLVFAIGGAAAAFAGVLAGIHFTNIAPEQGTAMLIFGFIVVVIGGMGSISGTAWAALAVGLLQQFANYYLWGLGEVFAVALLALVLLVRPQGLAGVAGGAHA